VAQTELKNRMKVVLLHPGTQYAHRLACQLNRLGLLDSFITGIAYTATDPLLRIFPSFVRRKIANRILDCGIPANRIKRIMLPELIALYKLSRGKNALQVMYQRNKYFQEVLPMGKINRADAVIGFDTSSWLIAPRVIHCDKPYFLDQSTIHVREKVEVVVRLKNQFPEWFIELPDKSPHQFQIEEDEYQMAKVVVVASTFTKNSLVKNGVQPSKIKINPYGVSNSFYTKKMKREGKIRFLYLGLVGPAKGVPLLLDVWRELSLHQHAELWIAGQAPLFFTDMLDELQGVRYKGRVPHNNLPELFNECDVLLFPSFFDGFGQVILEAMAAGLPVITTEATAGPDIIENEKDGILIRSGDKKALAASMQLFIKDRGLALGMGTLSQLKAKSFSWEAYGERWEKILMLK